MASYKVKSTPWPRVVGFYRDMVNKYGHNSLKPMLGFVEQIQAAEFADRIYGATSHARLLISYLPDFARMDRYFTWNLIRGSSR
jgi:hypothetical protein